jgi:UDP-glucuronate 4-epimerase
MRRCIQALAKNLNEAMVGDDPVTYASTDLLHEAVGFKPETSIEEGLRKFAEWYVEFYKVR